MAYFTQTLSGTFPEWNSRNEIIRNEIYEMMIWEEKQIGEELWQVF